MKHGTNKLTAPIEIFSRVAEAIYAIFHTSILVYPSPSTDPDDKVPPYWAELPQALRDEYVREVRTFFERAAAYGRYPLTLSIFSYVGTGIDFAHIVRAEELAARAIDLYLNLCANLVTELAYTRTLSAAKDARREEEARDAVAAAVAVTEAARGYRPLTDDELRAIERDVRVGSPAKADPPVENTEVGVDHSTGRDTTHEVHFIREENVVHKDRIMRAEKKPTRPAVSTGAWTAHVSASADGDVITNYAWPSEEARLRYMWIREACAEAAHNANRQYARSLGDESHLEWSHAPGWQRHSVLLGVDGVVLNGNGPRASHAAWMKVKLAEGWVCGPVKDATLKTHPCLVPYDDLPQSQQFKDLLFVRIVNTVAGAFGFALADEPED